MSVNGVLQLKKLKVFYSNWGGSSDETRALLQSKQWAQFKAENPAVEVESAVKGNTHPYLEATYIHGRSKTVCVRRNNALEILGRAKSLRDSRGRPTRTWVEKKRIVTQRPSIQGQWTPFFKFGGEPQANLEFKPVADKYPRPEYKVVKRRTESYVPSEETGTRPEKIRYTSEFLKNRFSKKKASL